MARLPFSLFKQGTHEYEVHDADARSDIAKINSDLTKHTLGAAVDLKSYTTNNRYIAPMDGYLVVGCAGTAGDYTYGYVDGVQLAGVSAPTSGTLAGFDTTSAPVRKGMGLYGACNDYTKQGAFVRFIPLT